MFTLVPTCFVRPLPQLNCNKEKEEFIIELTDIKDVGVGFEPTKSSV